MGIHVSKSLLDVSVPCKREDNSSVFRGLLGNIGVDFVEASAYCLSNAGGYTVEKKKTFAITLLLKGRGELTL